MTQHTVEQHKVICESLAPLLLKAQSGDVLLLSTNSQLNPQKQLSLQEIVQSAFAAQGITVSVRIITDAILSETQPASPAVVQTEEPKPQETPITTEVQRHARKNTKGDETISD